MVFLGKRGEKAKKGKKSWKKAKIWPKMVIFDVFWKSSKKNFNFALIRPFFGGRAQPLKMGVDFCPFWIETIWESVLRVPIRLLLSDAFFFGARGAPRGTPQIWHFSIFCYFWCFLLFFGLFWCFLTFLAVFGVFGHFWSFLVFFGLFCCFWCFWSFWLILGVFGPFLSFSLLLPRVTKIGAL